MTTIKLVLAAVALALAPALYAGEVKAAESAEVSSGTYSGRPAELVKGYRAIALSAPGDQLLYVKKGDRVDLMVTFEAVTEKNRKETVTVTVLQNAAVTNVVRPDKVEGAGTIELLLDPGEAQFAALSVAQAKNLSIVVRAPGDSELHSMEMASFRKLIK